MVHVSVFGIGGGEGDGSLCGTSVRDTMSTLNPFAARSFGLLRVKLLVSALLSVLSRWFGC